MASMRGGALRGNVASPDPTGLISVLEMDGPLPDDDPKTRRGGLDPRRQSDLGQIQMYASLRQQGAISDKAWARMIQRNPRSAVLFSTIGPSQQASLSRTRAEIGQQYFNPGSPEQNIITGPEDDQMVRFQPAVPAKADIQGAVLAALNKGDTEFATTLSGLNAKDSPYGKVDPKDYTPESLAKFSQTRSFADLVPRGKPEDTDRKAKLTFEQEEKLRGEYRGLSKDFLQVRDSYGRIQESAKNPSGAGDLALIFNYMKMLDPGSTVREGEFANAQNSAGVPERIQGMYNRVLSGERLADKSRADFVSRSGALYKRQLATQKKNESQYRKLAKQYGVDAERVVTNFDLEEMQQPALSENEITKVINGKTYVKRADGWYEK